MLWMILTALCATAFFLISRMKQGRKRTFTTYRYSLRDPAWGRNPNSTVIILPRR